MESETIRHLAEARQIAEGLPAMVERLERAQVWRGWIWGWMIAGSIGVGVAYWGGL